MKFSIETIVMDKKVVVLAIWEKHKNFSRNLCFYFIFFLFLVMLRLLREGVALEDLQSRLLGALWKSSGRGTY